MQVHKLDFDKTGFFSSLFPDYINQKDSLKEFYDLYPSTASILTKANSLNYSQDKRQQLHEVISTQYKGVAIQSSAKENIQALLSSNVVTITTGHQLNLFTGPLYFIFKIVTVVEACKRLNAQQKEVRFVPVYWMASEDHDFEEINHFFLFTKKYTWESQQQGPVGRFSTNGIERIFEEIREKLPLLESAYLKHDNLSQATRYLVNELFGKYGLVIIDADDKILKSFCKSVFKDELTNNTSYKIVKETTDRLTAAGYGGQVFSREINLFYMDKGIRERIVQEESGYKINNTEMRFTRDEILRVVDESPEKISPNVILRPVYQQVILPNVGYCGGPAELAYWLQLHDLFKHYAIDFPVLMPRMFAMVITKANFSRMEKLGLSIEDLFKEERELKEKFMASVSDSEHEMEEEIKEVESIFEKIKEKAKTIDPTLEGYVMGERQKLLKGMEQIEKRLKKAEEQKYETSLSQISNLKSKLFPEGSLQERRDNFLNFYIQDPSFIDKLSIISDPFDFRFNILIEDE